MLIIDQSKLTVEITNIYFVKDNTFFAVEKYNQMDLIEKEVGDSKTFDEFLPQQKIARWDNEVNFSARLVHDELTPTVSTLEDKIVWDGERVAVNFYDLPIDEINPEGASEFEVILKEKPKTNIVSFTIQTKGLDFAYQPDLTEKEMKDGAERPENVIGSYAVYASENKTNYVGGKEYKCGKVGHIFRPKIIDSAGTEVWGELKIDTEKGILSVAIPQDFLDKAVYPVRHAAGLTFGYTSVGETTTYAGPDLLGINLYTSPSNAANANSISLYCQRYSTSSFKAIITNNSFQILTNGIGGAVASESTAAWKISSFASAPAISGNTVYGIGIVYSSYMYIWYDAGLTSYTNENSYSSPFDMTDPYEIDYRISSYCTYTAASGSANLKSYNTNLKANIKSINTNLIANVKSLNTNV
ncbi:MAG: hypothetical protein WC451_04995 [Patescibacteria group bacterium]